MTAQPIPGPLALAAAPTPARLAARLLRLVTVRATAAATLEEATALVIHTRTCHDNTAALLVRDGLDGKNERERDAALRLALCMERDNLTVAEQAQRQARAQLEQIDQELTTLRAVARLVGGNDA